MPADDVLNSQVSLDVTEQMDPDAVWAGDNTVQSLTDPNTLGATTFTCFLHSLLSKVCLGGR